jgi:hypothetical protein
MALTTEGIPCPAGQWTLIADGDQTVIFKVREAGSVYIYAGTSVPTDLPPDDWTDFYTLVASRPFPGMKNLSASDRVWVCPKGDSAKTIEVIKA